MSWGPIVNQTKVAQHIGVSSRTVERWRANGDGPPFVRLGQRRVGYRVADVEAWASRRVHPSRAAEMAAAARRPDAREGTG